MAEMLVHAEIGPARQWVLAAQHAGRTVGLVPTMGALHRGHLALVERARAECDAVAVTIFVNPTQFVPGEDFERYPRPLDADLAACHAAGVELVFAPAVATMYPAGSVTEVHVAELTAGLCGPHRPGHFTGVATVVLKLFHILPADAAFFGEKDYQQLVVIQQLARDLDLPIRVVGCPTVREPDGLAMSSRNAYLSEAERAQARSLSAALFTARDRVAAGELDTAALLAEMRATITQAGPCTIDYVEIVDPTTLAPLPRVDRPARACLAVHVGACRLIDNVALTPPHPAVLDAAGAKG